MKIEITFLDTSHTVINDVTDINIDTKEIDIYTKNENKAMTSQTCIKATSVLMIRFLDN